MQNDMKMMSLTVIVGAMPVGVQVQVVGEKKAKKVNGRLENRTGLDRRNLEGIVHFHTIYRSDNTKLSFRKQPLPNSPPSLKQSAMSAKCMPLILVARP